MVMVVVKMAMMMLVVVTVRMVTMTLMSLIRGMKVLTSTLYLHRCDPGLASIDGGLVGGGWDLWEENRKVSSRTGRSTRGHRWSLHYQPSPIKAAARSGPSPSSASSYFSSTFFRVL